MPGQDSFELSAKLLRSCSSDTEPSPCDKEEVSCYKVKTSMGRNSQSPNTFVYRVKANDTLTSLAAFYDTTPSILKKFNKLAIDFLYPDQLLYIPVPTDSSSVSDTYTSSTSSCEDEYVTSDPSHVAGCERANRTIRLSSTPERLYSGFAHRHSPPCITSELESSYHQLPTGTEEVKKADTKEHGLHEMFVKLQSSHIISCQCQVTGTLLVTPNAVMFDPNVSDPLVVENGDEKYGLIAKLDTVISAAIYRDSQAMYNLHHKKDDPSITKPEVYHMKDCELMGGGSHDSVNNLITAADDGVENTPSEEHIDDTLSCSCGADSHSETLNRTILDTLNADNSPAVDQEVACLNISINREHSKVTFDVDEEAKSSPIDFGRTSTNTNNESADDAGIDYDLGEENVSQSIEKKLNLYQRKLGHCRTASLVSSLYSVGVTSTTELFVDYSCGMFVNGGSVPSCNRELVCNNTQNHNAAESIPADDQCDGAKHKASFTVHLEGGVSKDEKPTLFQPISNLVHDPFKSEVSASPPFYLCLQVGKPINKRCISDTCPIEAYKKQPKPEYWFTVPGDKVDDLYSFFVQWRPGLYGEEITDESTLNSRGFVAITNKVLESEHFSELTGSPMVRQLSHVQVLKDWEIISMDEIVRRTSLLDLERYLPFPDLVGESLLLSEEDIKKLAACLPARVEGHRWRLAYSNEEHGFSLQTMYRNMCEFDSATILVIQDENDGLFGAFSSSPLHLCEHFYGTGECFLFTYVDGFKQYNWTSKNMFCVRGDLLGLTIGTGSANCGLWLDAAMYHGRTQHCDTFDNEPLTGDAEDFIVKGVEVWSLNDEEYD